MTSTWVVGPQVGCVLRVQAVLGGELTSDLALGERPVQLCLARRWEEDGRRRDHGAGGLRERSQR